MRRLCGWRKMVFGNVASDLDISFDDDEDDLAPPLDGVEKRTEKRIRLGRIWLRYGDRDLPVSDISESGMFVDTKIAELPASGLFKFQFIAELNDSVINIPAKAQVVRHDKLRGYALLYDTSVEVWKNLFTNGFPPD